MPDRAERNSAIVQCRTRAVPLRALNERLNAKAGRKPVLTMAYAVGHISGGHFNCAVTIGLWACSRARTSPVHKAWRGPCSFPGKALRVIATHQLGRYRR